MWTEPCSPTGPGRISPHTRACIRALRAGGTLVFLSTGRHILELRSLPVGEMAFDGYITLNGQLCLDSSQQQLSSTPLPPQAVQALADLFCADGPPLALVEEERIYINRVTDAVRQAPGGNLHPYPRRSPPIPADRSIRPRPFAPEKRTPF